MAFILGVTGGIGSGKTEATDFFSTLGIEVIDADCISRTIVQKDSPALQAILQEFGPELQLANGELDRAQLRNIIFNVPDAKIWLENLLHPIIRKEIEHEILSITSVYGIVSSPLLFESQQHTLVNRTLVIDCSEELQIKRASERDQTSTSQITSIIKTQWPRNKRNQQADDIISNNGTLTELYCAIERYHQILLNTYV